jgi:DNA repair protein RadC
MNPSKRSRSPASHEIPLYEVRLVQAGVLKLAENCLFEPSRCARALHALIGLTDREHLACLFVNPRHHVTGAHIAAIGGQHTIATVDVRVILRAALVACASGLVLGHNHPAGDPTPSNEDLLTTANIMRAANTIGIRVLDHLIVTCDELRYYSMYSAGTLPSGT